MLASEGFTRKIVGVPKAESDVVLSFLFAQLSNNPDFQVRIRWSKNQIVFWDNRVSIAVQIAKTSVAFANLLISYTHLFSISAFRCISLGRYALCDL